MGGGRPDQLRSLMSGLMQRSLLSAEGESPQRLLRIHDLLAAYCRKTGTDGRLPPLSYLETYQAMVKCIFLAPRNRGGLRAPIPHGSG